MLNHLVALDGYLANRRCREALEYIHKLNDELDFSKRGIISGNMVVDALLSNRKSRTAEKGIEFEYEVMVPGKFKIDDMDICIILGNALDNAIEACQRLTDEQMKKRIVLEVKYKRDSVLIEVKNSYDLSTIKKRNGRYVSSKRYQEKDELGTGTGTGNMEEIIEKYGGVYQTDLQEEVFVLKMMIPDINIGSY